VFTRSQVHIGLNNKGLRPKGEIMKKLLTILAVLTLTSMSFASQTVQKHPAKKKMSKTVVKGKKAKRIYMALDSDIETKNRQKFSADIKKVGPLRCVKLTKKEDTSVVKFRCALKGKKGKKGQRRQRRGHRHAHNH